MARTFVLHDESVNTHGFRMLTSGANLEEFRKNPVMLHSHNDWMLPIGRWENIRIEGTRILADAVFDEDDEEAVRIMNKVDNNFIRMASIGAWAPEEVNNDPALMLDGQTLPTVTKWTVREASIVTIGANHNAVVLYDRATKKAIGKDGVIALMDNSKIIDKPKKESVMNEELKKVLQLSDTATDADIKSKVEELVALKDSQASKIAVLEQSIEGYKAKDEQARKNEAIALTDSAIKSGKYDAKGKESLLALFDKDFEGTKAMLASIPERASVVQKIENEGKDNEVQLSDMLKKSWRELDREGLLVKLKDTSLDDYKKKFKEYFGVEPKNV